MFGRSATPSPSHEHLPPRRRSSRSVTGPDPVLCSTLQVMRLCCVWQQLHTRLLSHRVQRPCCWTDCLQAECRPAFRGEPFLWHPYLAVVCASYVTVSRMIICCRRRRVAKHARAHLIPWRKALAARAGVRLVGASHIIGSSATWHCMYRPGGTPLSRESLNSSLCHGLLQLSRACRGANLQPKAPGCPLLGMRAWASSYTAASAGKVLSAGKTETCLYELFLSVSIGYYRRLQSNIC